MDKWKQVMGPFWVADIFKIIWVKIQNLREYAAVDGIIIIIIITAIVLSPGGSGYFTCMQNMKLVTNKFKSGGLHEKHVVATWNVGNHLSICL